MRSHSNFVRFAACWMVAAAACSTSVGAIFDGYAAMGASETQGTNHFGSWVPWLVTDRGFNFGPSQSYNRAVGGSTTTTLLSGGQHTQVANIVANGDAEGAFLFIGGLDVPPVALSMINGTLNVPNWANGVVTRISTAMDTVLAQNPQGMVVAGIPDMSLVPGAAAFALLAQPVVDAIDYTNVLLEAEVLSRNLVYLDVASLMRDMNAEPLVVGGVTINTTTGSTNPTHFFSDEIHPGTVGNGLFANLMLTALNDAYDANVPLFTDLEILTRAGLAGSYTMETSNVNFSSYVSFNPVPEPSSVAMVSIALIAFAIAALRSRSRVGVETGSVRLAGARGTDSR